MENSWHVLHNICIVIFQGGLVTYTDQMIVGDVITSLYVSSVRNGYFSKVSESTEWCVFIDVFLLQI